MEDNNTAVSARVHGRLVPGLPGRRPAAEKVQLKYRYHFFNICELFKCGCPTMLCMLYCHVL